MMTIPNAIPAGDAPTAPTSSAVQPEGSSSDFMTLLAKIVGEPAQQAVTPLATLTDGDLETQANGTEGELPEALALLPFALAAESLPQAVPPQQKMDGAGVAALIGDASRAVDIRALGEMIRGEQQAAAGADSGASDAFALLSSVDSAHAPKTAASDLLSRPVQAPVGSSQWADEIASRLTLMTEQGKQAASLRLSPEHLGPLEIRISIKDDQASVWFGAAHADTRAAIEHALPRLRELFESQGMSLADAGVYQHTPREQQHSAQPGTADPLGVQPESTIEHVLIRNGLIDAYA